MIIIKRVTEFSELEGIKSLQEENLKKNLPADEAETEGFVTAEYTIEFLKTLHEAGPSIIAKDNDTVVGYALVADKSIRYQHELLSDLFNCIDQITYRGLLLKKVNYVVVGQLCVAKNYRGLGLVQQMYQHFADLFNTGRMTAGDLQGAMRGFQTFMDQYAKRVQTAGSQNKTLTRALAAEYLQHAGGDKNKARVLAKKDGYTF